MKFFVAIVLIFTASMAICDESESHALHQTQITRSIFKSMSNSPPKDIFKAYHYLKKRSYDLKSEEGNRRFKIFEKNLKFIQETNASNPGYTLGLNQSADMTLEEYAEHYLMKTSSVSEQDQGELSFFDKYADSDEDEAAVSDSSNDEFFEVSWEKYKTPTRDQKYCGSCWAFASLTAVATNYLKNYGVALDLLSPQYLVDCDLNNNGCLVALVIEFSLASEKWE